MFLTALKIYDFHKFWWNEELDILKDFQAPVLFSSIFKTLNLGEKNQALSRTFKDAWEPVADRGEGERQGAMPPPP